MFIGSSPIGVPGKTQGMMFTPIDVKLLQYEAEWVGIDRIQKVSATWFTVPSPCVKLVFLLWAGLFQKARCDHGTVRVSTCDGGDRTSALDTGRHSQLCQFRQGIGIYRAQILRWSVKVVVIGTHAEVKVMSWISTGVEVAVSKEAKSQYSRPQKWNPTSRSSLKS